MLALLVVSSLLAVVHSNNVKVHFCCKCVGFV